jgi:hypothetical protein
MDVSATDIRTSAAPSLHRLAAALVLVVLAAGCVVLWVGVPIGGVWLAGQLTASSGYHLPLALLLIVPAMFLVAVALAWVNSLWLRITGGEVVLVRQVPVRRRGPLEVMLPVCGILAAIALVIWFLLFAENPSSQFL